MAETIRKNVDLDILDYYDTKIKDYVDDKVGTGGVTIDTALSDTSTNPVQNKVVKQAIDNKADKTVATTEANGLMSASDKKRFNNIGNVYALKSLYGDTTIDVGRKTGTDVGICSDAEGWHTTASGNYSHTEGLSTTASNRCSHAEGVSTVASGESSHAEGVGAVAFGDYSHARGYNTITNNTCETASGKYNVSNDNTLFSIGDGTADDARHNAFEITTTGGKLHDKDIATTDLIPTTLPANGGNADYATNAGNASTLFINDSNKNGIFYWRGGDGQPSWLWGGHDGQNMFVYSPQNLNVNHANTAGNADTVDGLHANNFTQIIDFGFTETDTKTAIGQSGKTTIYRCSKWTDYPSGCHDGQGTVIAINYSGAGTVGTDSMWVKQIFISAHYDAPLFHIRYVDNTTVGNWKEISTTPIKKISFPSVATNAGGGGSLFSADFGTPITIACTSRADTQCTPFFC